MSRKFGQRYKLIEKEKEMVGKYMQKMYFICKQVSVTPTNLAYVCPYSIFIL